MSNEFKRENRYIVLKRKHLENLPSALQVRLKPVLDEADELMPQLECLVIESDWPEYQPTWAAIEARMTCSGDQPPALGGEPVDETESFAYKLEYLGKIDRCDVACGSYGDKFHRWDDAGPYVEYEDHLKHIDIYKAEVDRLSAHLAPLHAEIERLKETVEDSTQIILQQGDSVNQLKARCDELHRMLGLSWGSGDVSAEDCRKIDAALSKPAGSEQ